MKPVTRRILGIALSFSTTTGACITVRSHDVPEAAWPPVSPATDASERPTVSVDVVARSVRNGESRGLTQLFLRQLTTGFTDAFRESGAFSEVLENADDADCRVTIRLEIDSKGSLALARLCGATLGVIPATARDRFCVSAEFFAHGGQRVGEAYFEEENRLWAHLLVIPLMPFFWPETKGTECLRELGRATVLAALDGGLGQASGGR